MEAYSVTTFLSSLNWRKYQELLDELVNFCLVNHDECPKTWTHTYQRVTGWSKKSQGGFQRNDNGLNFSIVKEGTDDVEATVNTHDSNTLLKPNITDVEYFECGKNHYPFNCKKYKKKLADKKATEKEDGGNQVGEQHMTISNVGDNWDNDVIFLHLFHLI